MTIEVDNWHKCYSGGWSGLICDTAMVHPAKFSRALIRRIYEHCFEEGWLQPGATVCDPFGGVCLGALHAMKHGLNWVGVELEDRFVQLGRQNIDLWNKRYSRLPGWGTAQIIQGDSRQLTMVLAQADLCLSSPPYSNGTVHGGFGSAVRDLLGDADRAMGDYGQTEGNLGNFPDGGLKMAISSPPYADSMSSEKSGIDWSQCRREDGSLRDMTKEPAHAHRPGAGAEMQYGVSEGQLGQMQEGEFDVCISSPPFETVVNTKDPKYVLEKRLFGDYGDSEGQLGAMRGGEFAACVSSPPFGGSELSTDEQFRAKMDNPGDAYTSPANIARETNDTFWSASRTILEQVYQILIPGGHAIFVLKAFVRNKQIVDFPGQWRELCEAVGFTTLHVHRAWLVEERGAQYTLDGKLDVKRVKRCSFFRRLHERKYPHLSIDFEEILCLVK